MPYVVVLCYVNMLCYVLGTWGLEDGVEIDGSPSLTYSMSTSVQLHVFLRVPECRVLPNLKTTGPADYGEVGFVLDSKTGEFLVTAGGNKDFSRATGTIPELYAVYAVSF